jgi:hypothetical protein
MQQLFQVPASIQGISTLKDRTLKITAYISRELPADEKTKIFELENMEGWLLFSPNFFQPEQIPKEPAKMENNRKSASERLYNVMYVYWNQNFSGGNFNQWRDEEMEKIITDYKTKLI